MLHALNDEVKFVISCLRACMHAYIKVTAFSILDIATIKDYVMHIANGFNTMKQAESSSTTVQIFNSACLVSACL